MKILHTSDWHLGKRLADTDRSETYTKFLEWLTGTIIEESVDALIVAGDIFDTTAPSHASQKQYYDFLAELAETCCRTVVVIGGNHDSPNFLNATSILLKPRGTYIFGNIPDDVREQVIEASDKDGNIGAIICAVPYLRERDVYFPGEDESALNREVQVAKAIGKHYRKVFEEACRVRGDRSVPIVMTGHLFAAGTTLSDNDKEKYILGNLGQIPTDIFPRDVDYVALGHIHKPQLLDGDESRNYCGTPYAMDFKDGNVQKFVRIVEFAGGNRSVRTVNVPKFSKIEQIKGTEESIEQRLKELVEEGDEISCEAVHEGEDYAPGLVSRLKEVVKGTKVALLRIRDTTHERVYRSSMVDEEFVQELTPEIAFEKRLECESITDENKEELRKLYRSVLENLNSESPDETK